MKAMIHTRYGPPEVLQLAERPTPALGPRDVLIRVHATTATTGDWRQRAAAFPGIMALPGRLMTGVLKPRNQILGGEFSGTIAATGREVTRFRRGDSVFGFCGTGGNAEYVAMNEDGALAAKPAQLGHEEAAALPFGALSALTFLRDLGGIRPGHEVLILGASGGVGAPAVQIARHFGAHVTGVASGANAELLRDLGAHRAIDYRIHDVTRQPGRFDLIFDTVGALGFRDARRILTPQGRLLSLNFAARELLQSALTARSTGQRVMTGIASESREDMETVARLAAAGALRPVIDRCLPLAKAAEAHRRVETRHKRGSIVLTVPLYPADWDSAAA